MTAPTKASLGVVDAAVLSRANHTGAQAISTVTGLQDALDAKFDVDETQERFCAYGGTANAITLTSGLDLTSIPDGFKAVFRATAANTGAMTADLDGLGAKAVKTVTGADTPAGYIRVSASPAFVTTEMRWSAIGDCWIADRQIERGSNPNGTFTRFADGRMVCTYLQASSTQATTAAGNVFRTGSNTWTFPAAYALEPVVQRQSDGSPGFSWGGIGSGVTSTTLCTWSVFAPTSSANAPECHLTADGPWY